MNYVFEDIKRQFVGRSMLAKIIIVNAAIFFLTVLTGVVINVFLNNETLGALFAENGYFLAVPAEVGVLIFRPWTIITHMFTHTDFWHMFWNMLWLYFMGALLVNDLGNRKLLSTYILGGLSGFLLYFLMFNLFDALPTHSIALGASGAVFAIVALIGSYSPNTKLNLFGILPVKLWVLALIFILRDVLEMRSGVNVGGHLAHLGGAIFGFVNGRALLHGKDYMAGFENFLDRFFNFFKGGDRTKMKVIKKKKATKKGRGKTDEDYNREKYETQQQIDRILDKISKSGYDSLSKFEKDFLANQGN